MVRQGRYIALLLILISVYALYLPVFHNILKERSAIQKLGYTPTGRFYRSVVGEYRWFMGDYLSFKSVIYYGGKVKDIVAGNLREVEYYNLYRTVEASVLLNPYNEDIYYFAQGVFTWDIGRIQEVNALLEYGLKYRTWDYQMPFFLGFNYAYFLKDYKKAAVYYQKASEISKSPLFTNLAARYLYEGGETALAIGYLRAMIQTTRQEEVKKQYIVRLKALEAVNIIEQAVKRYISEYNTKPTIEALVKSGILKEIPKDPYGGRFYIDENGKVRTTSKMAFVNR